MLDAVLKFWQRMRNRSRTRNAERYYRALGHPYPIAAAHDETAMLALLQQFREQVSAEYLKTREHPDKIATAWLKVWGPATYKVYGRLFGASLKKSIMDMRTDEMLIGEAAKAWDAHTDEAVAELRAMLKGSGTPPAMKRLLG